MELDRAIKNRKSVKKFSDKKPDWRDIIECIDLARYAPIAGNNYVVKFIVVDDAKKIQKIADAAQQPFIAKAHYVVVVCSNPKRIINAYEERGKIYTRQQAGAAIQNFLLKIEEVGLETTWVGHFVESMIKKELKIPKEVQIEAVFPIGYQYEKKYTRKIKIDLDAILRFNDYKNTKLKKVKQVDA
jgi:nitroreductase